MSAAGLKADFTTALLVLGPCECDGEYAIERRYPSPT